MSVNLSYLHLPHLIWCGEHFGWWCVSTYSVSLPCLGMALIPVLDIRLTAVFFTDSLTFCRCASSGADVIPFLLYSSASVWVTNHLLLRASWLPRHSRLTRDISLCLVSTCLWVHHPDVLSSHLSCVVVVVAVRITPHQSSAHPVEGESTAGGVGLRHEQSSVCLRFANRVPRRLGESPWRTESALGDALASVPERRRTVRLSSGDGGGSASHEPTLTQSESEVNRHFYSSYSELVQSGLDSSLSSLSQLK